MAKKKNDKPTKKQMEILDFIKKELDEKGYPPSIREICAGTNLKSTSSVFAHLENLEIKGYIKRDPTKPRAIEVVGYSGNTDMIKIPVFSPLDILSGEHKGSKGERFYTLPKTAVPEGSCIGVYFDNSTQGSVIQLKNKYVFIKLSDKTDKDELILVKHDNRICVSSRPEGKVVGTVFAIMAKF